MTKATKPSEVDILNQALANHREGRLAEAATGYHKILQVNPRHSDALHLLGVILQQKGQYSTAIELMQAAISQNAKVPYYHNNLANTYLKADRPKEAAESYRQAVLLKPDYVEAHNGIGNSLSALNHEELAAEAYRCAIAIKPAFAEAHYNLGRMLDMLGKPEEAIASYRSAIKLDAANPDYHFNLAGLLLMQSYLTEGWEEYEWRWKLRDFTNTSRDSICPRWEGQPLAGAPILLHAEQGYGDTVQFARYATLVARRGGTVYLEVQPGLEQLMSSVPGVSRIMTQGDPIPEVAWQCPLMSLPRVFGTTMDTIPSFSSYLSVRREDIALARTLYPTSDRRVGVVWAGNHTHRHNSHRSMKLRDLLPLVKTPKTTFFSLQVGDNSATEIEEISTDFPIIDACSRNTDFLQTAALIASLDLVITVDTAVAHLAGALGVPTWILLSHNRTDWRWFKARKDTPWYPKTLLFRQKNPGAWEHPLEEIQNELKRMPGER